MAREITTGPPPVPPALMEHRILELEIRLATVAQALSDLTKALEGTPLAPSTPESVAHAARRARETLLSAGLIHG